MMNTNLLSFLHSFYTNNPFISQKRFFSIQFPMSKLVPKNTSSNIMSYYVDTLLIYCDIHNKTLVRYYDKPSHNILTYYSDHGFISSDIHHYTVYHNSVTSNLLHKDLQSFCSMLPVNDYILYISLDIDRKYIDLINKIVVNYGVINNKFVLPKHCLTNIELIQSSIAHTIFRFFALLQSCFQNKDDRMKYKSRLCNLLHVKWTTGIKFCCIFVPNSDIEPNNKISHTNNSESKNVSIHDTTFKSSNKNLGKRQFSTTTKFYDTSKKDITQYVEDNLNNNITHDVNIYKSNLLNKINIILANEHMLNNDQIQMRIEDYMFNEYEYVITNKVTMVQEIDISKIPGDVGNLIIDKLPMLNTYIDNMKQVFEAENSQAGRYRNIIIYHLSNDYIINLLLNKFLLVLTYTDCDEYNDDYVSYLKTSIDIGKKMEQVCLNTLRKMDERQSKRSINKREWLNMWFDVDSNEWMKKYHNNDEFYCTFGTKMLEIMESCELLGKKLIRSDRDKTHYNLVIMNKNIIKKHTNKVYTIPGSLPMIVPPKPFDSDVLGGYLLNDTYYNDELIKEKVTSHKHSIINKKNSVYNMVNKVSCIPFKVNKELLEFISNNKQFNLLLNEESIPNFSKVRLTKIEKKNYTSAKSKLILQETILEIANLYKNYNEIYFPVKLDYRGRLYCVPSYLNYQSNELSKALLLFSKEGIIRKEDNSSIMYMKAYGANCFGGSIAKKTLQDKSNWIDTVTNDIINYDNGVLLSKANSKLLFLSFCMEYKKYVEHIQDEHQTEFHTHLPIQLDATCNGFQHLALLSNEETLFEELNLVSSDVNNPPGDLYNFLIHKIYEDIRLKISNIKEEISVAEKAKKVNTDEIKQYRSDIESYNRLLSVMWERSNLKKAVMTLPYNARHRSTKEYITNSLILDGYDEKIKCNWYNTSTDNNSIKINDKDVSLLSTLIRNIIFVDFQKIKNLCKYLKTVANLCNKLEIPITWSLPSGITVLQSYALTETATITPFDRSKKTLKLSKIDNKKYDNSRQLRSLMPNLIHSLDATSMTLMYELFSKYFDKPQFFSIHDCFATTTDKVFVMKTMLASVYTIIYSDSIYLEKFDNAIFDYIQNNTNCTVDRYKRTISWDDNKFRLHDINWVLNKKLVSDSTINKIDAQYIMI